MGSTGAADQRLLAELRAAGLLDLSAMLADSTHLRALKRDHTGPSPVDRRKPGSKHLINNATSIPLAIVLTGGNRNDVTQLIPLIDAIPPIRGSAYPGGARAGSTPTPATTTTSTAASSVLEAARRHRPTRCRAWLRSGHGSVAGGAHLRLDQGHRQPVPPAGLAGWPWRILDLVAVPVRPRDVLHGDGMALLRQHFASYRPLVTATALGGAAAVFDTITTGLTARQAPGICPGCGTRR